MAREDASHAENAHEESRRETEQLQVCMASLRTIPCIDNCLVMHSTARQGTCNLGMLCADPPAACTDGISG
jgi:hypothetical protein